MKSLVERIEADEEVDALEEIKRIREELIVIRNAAIIEDFGKNTQIIVSLSHAISNLAWVMGEE